MNENNYYNNESFEKYEYSFFDEIAFKFYLDIFEEYEMESSEIFKDWAWIKVSITDDSMSITNDKNGPVIGSPNAFWFKDINDPKFNKVLKAYLDAHMVNGVCFRKCAEGYLNDMQLYDEVLSAAVPDICQKEYDFSERGAQKLTSITDLLSYPQYYDEHFKSQLTEYSVQSSRIKAAHAYLLKSLKTIPQYIVIENLMDSIKVLLEFVQNKTAENSYIEGAEAAYRIIKEKYSEIEIDYDFEHRSLPKVSETKILPEDYYIESEFLDRLNKMFKSE